MGGLLFGISRPLCVDCAKESGKYDNRYIDATALTVRASRRRRVRSRASIRADRYNRKGKSEPEKQKGHDGT